MKEDKSVIRLGTLIHAVRSQFYGATTTKVAEILGITKMAAAKRLERAIKDGDIERVGRGMYAAKRASLKEEP